MPLSEDRGKRQGPTSPKASISEDDSDFETKREKDGYSR